MSVTAETGQARESRDGVGHVRSLDGMRFFAFLAVFVYHAYNENPALTRVARYGSLGVQVFFVLSGFLIGGGLLALRGATHVPLKTRLTSFYARRSLRIFPIYYLVLGALLLLELFGLSQVGGRTLLPWTTTYTANVKFALDEASFGGGLSHLWSLCVEEHFYLLVPLLILCCSVRMISWAIVAGCVIAAVGRTALHLAGWDLVWMLSPLQFDYLLVGIAAAIVHANGNFLGIGVDRFLRWCNVAAVSCVPLLLLWQLDSSATRAIGDALNGVVLSLAVAGLTLRLWRSMPGTISKVLSVRPFPYLGKISYALYLLHLPLLVFAAAWFKGMPGTAVPALALTVLLAAMSWRWVEGPINAQKRRFAVPAATGSRVEGESTVTSVAGAVREDAREQPTLWPTMVGTLGGAAACTPTATTSSHHRVGQQHP
jgi:peptidoglycan/LPS O-acetylase OafA/YrhL